MNNKILLSVVVILILLTVFSLNIPFFWDGTFFSALSINFYDSGFHGFIAPPSNDTGGFPLFSAYLATIWKCFGKTLTVSHLAMLPFLLGTAWEYFKFAKRWLEGTSLFFAMILLILEPVFLTQSMLMGYDVVIAYFFLLSLNLLLNKRSTAFSIALSFLCLVSVRGMMLASALFFIDMVINKKNDYTFLKSYLPAIFLLLLWMFYHHSRTGWYIFSPERAGNAEAFADPKMIFRQVIYTVWKNLDIGRITLWLTLAVGYYYFLRRAQEGKDLVKLIFIPLITLTIFMCLIRNPIAPKYFMVVFYLLNIGVCFVIRHLEKRIMQIVIFFSVCISLVCGNFIVYPQRYGNAWDSTLKVYPYFKLKAEMDRYITERDIDRNFVFTQFPLTADHFSTDLQPYSRCYTDIEDLPVGDVGYFLYSNVINTNRINDLEEIQKTWDVEKEFKEGLVVITLYRNPALSQSVPAGLSLEDPGTATAPSQRTAMP